ncbi:GMC family oxidoreductase [Mucilaginibacter aquariorum]|uniref:GMC family oxidoreductase N-terminal domain-containing protein n=1 Tax=Mucilaginibacter aquariorum TaxID=2967225 RepID=A0ABT1SZ95_9SPHI|nr:GMC family oxidoreductase N-terminal domain-containing protein [Mucilaginibacter aquariorum]MCQ6957038.1 GMC family oxidoreductase N-terminal domain-containing protein [Mucilaginibacter aquariorum]
MTNKIENSVSTNLKNDTNTFIYDYIIVGGGSAGCVLARRLSDCENITVLLIEAGADDNGLDRIQRPLRWLENIGSPQDYLYRYQPNPILNNREIYAPRGKVLGGSGSINAMVWARGNQNDYDSWAEAGNTGWDYESILPLFRKIEDWDNGENSIHGKDGPIRVERPEKLHVIDAAAVKAGISYGMPYMEDSNIPAPEGVGLMSMNIGHGRRSSPFEGYLKPIIDKPNLNILTDAKVLKLNIDNGVCTGLIYRKDDKEVTVAAKTEVVLSAGTFETPRILMLSGVGDAVELKNLGIDLKVNLPGVGKNLQDHPLISLTFQLNQPLADLTYNLGGINYYWKSSPDLIKPDLMLIPIQYPILTQELAAKYEVPDNAFSVFVTLIDIKSKGYMKLTSSLPDAPLEIEPNLLKDPADFQAMVKAVELCMDLTQEPDLNKIIKSWVAPDRRLKEGHLAEFIRNGCSTYFHPVGTCAMGKGPDAVVNNRLKVIGVQKLSIADASVMPQITTSNTNAPTIMIAEFAAEVLLGTR